MGDSTPKDPLGLSFFVFVALMERWFDVEPSHEAFFAELRKDFPTRDALVNIPNETRSQIKLISERRASLRATLQEHSMPILFFADAQGIDVVPLLRFMRAVEERCNVREVDKQLALDAVEKASLRHLAQRKDQGELPASFTSTQRAAYVLVLEEGPILGKKLAGRMEIELGTLKRHVLPPLRTVGLKNDRIRGGYYIDR